MDFRFERVENMLGKRLVVSWLVGWLVVLGLNATLAAKVISWRSVTHVFPGFLTPVLTQNSFQSHRLLFSQASAEVRGENTTERKVASTGDRTHNHQVMSPTRSSLSHPGGANGKREKMLEISIFSFSHNVLKNYYVSELLTLSQTSPGFYVSAVQVF